MGKSKARRLPAAWYGFGAVAALAAAQGQAQAGELHLLNYGAPSVLGIQGNRHAEIGRFGVSDDGRRAAFATASNNLVAGDSNEYSDIYVSDAQTGELMRISRRPDGAEPNGRSFDAAISGDGSRVAYQSEATDIVPDAVPGRGVFLADLHSGQTRRLTPYLPSVNGTAATVSGVVVSRQGTRVVFVTDSPLLLEDTDSVGDLYGWTEGSDGLRLLSTDTNGQPLVGVVDAASAALSADGRYVSFSMRTIDSIPGQGGIFVRDLEQPVLDRVWGPASSSSMSATALSADARFVAFSTYEAIAAGDGNGKSDVYLFDRVTRAVEAVSVAAGGAIGNDGSTHAVMSGDARYVVFASAATNFEPGVSGTHLYRRDRVSAATTRLTPITAGAATWYPFPAMSRDTGRVLFYAYDEDLVDGDDNQRSDVFAIDADGSLARISQASGAARVAGATNGHYFTIGTGRAFPLGDGGTIAFASVADNLGPLRKAGVYRAGIAGAPPVEVPLDQLPDHPNWPIALMLVGASADGSELLVRREPFDFTGGWGPGPLPAEPWDLWRVGTAGQTRIDTPAAVGAGARTTQAMLSDDGRHALFVSYVPSNGPLLQSWRLFLHDAQTGLLLRVDANDQGVPADRPIQPRSGLSRNGRYSAFVTAAGNLVANDADDSVDLFLRDNQTAQLTRLRHPQTGTPLVAPLHVNTEAIVVSDDGMQIAFVDSIGQYGEKKVLRLLDRTTQTLADVCGDGTTVFVHCVEPTLSADGSVLAFTSAQPLLPQDMDVSRDVYSYRPALGWLQLESVDAYGEPGRGQRMAPRLSASGASLTFQAIGGGWRTTPQITGDADWLFKRMPGDAIFDDGFDAP